MSLEAGRVGVNESEVDPFGKLKINGASVEQVVKNTADIEKLNTDLVSFEDDGYVPKKLETTEVQGYAISENGTRTANSDFKIVGFIDVSDYQNVVVQLNTGIRGGTEGRTVRIHGYNANSDSGWIRQIKAERVLDNTNELFNIETSDINYICISTYKDDEVIIKNSMSNVELTESLIKSKTIRVTSDSNGAYTLGKEEIENGVLISAITTGIMINPYKSPTSNDYILFFTDWSSTKTEIVKAPNKTLDVTLYYIKGE